jgi:hypothetical protein
LHNLALFWVKNANFFAEIFGENILKIITSVPDCLWEHWSAGTFIFFYRDHGTCICPSSAWVSDLMSINKIFYRVPQKLFSFFMWPPQICKKYSPMPTVSADWKKVEIYYLPLYSEFLQMSLSRKVWKCYSWIKDSCRW